MANTPLRSQKADVDLRDTHQWLRNAALKADTERFIVAAQDRASSQEIFRLIFFIMGLTLGVDSAIQVPTLLTISQSAPFSLPMSIQTDTIVFIQ